MTRFIPYNKLSKKEQRKRNAASRRTWGDLNPITRTPPNSKAYNRKRTQDWKKEFQPASDFLLLRAAVALRWPLCYNRGNF